MFKTKQPSQDPKGHYDRAHHNHTQGGDKLGGAVGHQRENTYSSDVSEQARDTTVYRSSMARAGKRMRISLFNMVGIAHAIAAG
jgi:hypothetical protein